MTRQQRRLRREDYYDFGGINFKDVYDTRQMNDKDIVVCSYGTLQDLCDYEEQKNEILEEY